MAEIVDKEGRTDAVEMRELEETRRKSLQAIKNQLSRSELFGDGDYKVYEEVISDKGLARAGMIRHRDKIKYLRDQAAGSMMTDILKKAKKVESLFPEIRKASSSGWISEQKANWWIAKLKDKKTPFHKKHLFMFGQGEGEDIKNESEFRKFINNWKTVAEEAKKLRAHPQIKKLTDADVSQLATFLDHKQFLNLKYKNREALVKTVSAALTAKEREIPQLYTKARSMLNWAVQRQALSPGKVGSWLERIFTSDAKANDIEKFLSNEGNNPLQTLMNNWVQASNHFHKLEAKRKSLGTPPGFHFVKMDVFLNWKYDQRTAYLDEAEQRFNNIKDESYVFLKIRHELGAEDWESAEELIDSVNQELESGSLLMSEENRSKLKIMEKYLQAHRKDKGKDKKKEQNPSNEEIIAEMESLVAQLPWQLQRTYIKALNKGYQAFWALTTLMYNRVWCHQHNYLDVGKERRWEEDAKKKTRKRVALGQHDRIGHEMNVVKGDTNTRAAIRDQSNAKGAQILYTDHRSDSTLVDEIDEQKNDRNFWYWTSMIPEGVEYTKHLEIVQRVNPRMKKLARLMENRGLRYSLSFDAADAEPEYVAAK